MARPLLQLVAAGIVLLAMPVQAQPVTALDETNMRLLGDYTAASSVLQEARDTCRQKGGDCTGTYVLSVDLAADVGELDQARQFAERALETARTADDKLRAIAAIVRVGYWQGELDRASRDMQRARPFFHGDTTLRGYIEFARAQAVLLQFTDVPTSDTILSRVTLGRDFDCPKTLLDLCVEIWANAVGAAKMRGDIDGALALARDLVASFARQNGGTSAVHADMRMVLAQTLQAAGRQDEAVEQARAALTTLEALLDPRSVRLAKARLAYASIIARSDVRLAEAQLLVRSGGKALVEALGEYHFELGIALLDYARILGQRGQHAEALDFAGRAARIMERFNGDTWWGPALAMATKADALEGLDRNDETRAIMAEVERRYTALYGAQNALTRIVRIQRAQIEARVGDRNVARRLLAGEVGRYLSDTSAAAVKERVFSTYADVLADDRTALPEARSWSARAMIAAQEAARRYRPTDPGPSRSNRRIFKRHVTIAWRLAENQ